LPKSIHPIALGADICCDSAHKTLPALTGASYLHLSRSLPPFFQEHAKSAMALFGSTSPSYLILASLDRVNARLADDLPGEFLRLAEKIGNVKEKLSSAGYTIAGDEPMKITVMPKSIGYLGTELAQILTNNRFIPEFSDPDHLVLMPGVGTEDRELDRLAELLTALPKKAPISISAPKFTLPKSRMKIREAAMAPSERIAAKDSLGRILAECNIACPPAVPIAVYGEVIGEDIIKAFEYYGIKYINAVKK
jgi:arginine/lysine/ornithine decarboxylase